jgi:hypothetical protein
MPTMCTAVFFDGSVGERELDCGLNGWEVVGDEYDKDH